MAPGPITSWHRDDEKVETVTDFIFLGSKITVDIDWSHKTKRYLLFGRKTMTNLDSILKIRDITLPTKVRIVTQSYGFSSSHIQMWELDHKEGWVPKNWCFQIVVLKKTPESPLDCKIKLVNPKGNQPWIFTGRTDAEALILWQPDRKSWLKKKKKKKELTHLKTCHAGKDWRQKDMGVVEDEIASLT